MELITFPDAEATILAGIALVLSDVDVVDTVPTSRTLDDTFLLCRRVGGPSRSVVVDDASVTLEGWAPSREQAHDLLQNARAALHALVGTTVDGVPVYRVQEFAGPAYLPDPDSNHPRYTLTASVSLRGAVSGS